MLIKETNVTITIRDMDRSISFYSSLGFSVKNRWHNHYAQLTAPGIIIGLHPSTDKDLAQNSGNVSIGFITENFDMAKAHLKGSGIIIHERKEEGGRFIHFSDPDGTLLYFYNS